MRRSSCHSSQCSLELEGAPPLPGLPSEAPNVGPCPPWCAARRVWRRWLARDLANVDRCVTPWLVVGMHRPFYVVYPHKDNRVVGDHLRDFIEDLLLEYQVDLTLAGKGVCRAPVRSFLVWGGEGPVLCSVRGTKRKPPPICWEDDGRAPRSLVRAGGVGVGAGHVHTYYRTCDVREERCTEDGSGVVHFVIGTAGHKLSDITDEQRDWLDGDVNDWGFVRFDVDDDTMHASFILSKSGQESSCTLVLLVPRCRPLCWSAWRERGCALHRADAVCASRNVTDVQARWRTAPSW